MRHLGVRRALLCLALAMPFLALAQTAAPTKAKPTPAAKKPVPRKIDPDKPEPPWLTPQQATQRYQEAEKAEREGFHRHAFVAYLEAAENGHGHAQKKMGDLYSRDGPIVRRDYQIALQWYEKARAQGVPIPKPPAFTRGH